MSKHRNQDARFFSGGWVAAYALVILQTVVITAAASATNFIGWQTFSNCTPGNNNSGVCDTTPESNSTFDATPVGSIGPDNTYLSGAIGVNASSAGRKGRGQQTNNAFLNGDGFGNEAADSSRLIENITLSDGTPGMRIGPFGSAMQGAPDGTSSWKFSTSGNERTGDFRITNESSFYFRVQFIHFDARLGNANSPRNLEVRYLAGDGTAFDNALTRLDNGFELVDLNNIYNNDFGPFVMGSQTTHVSHSIGGVIGTQAYLAPGDSAGFRFVWTGQLTNGAESQLDNLAVEGKFFLTENLVTEVDVPEPGLVMTIPFGLGLLGILGRRRRFLSKQPAARVA